MGKKSLKHWGRLDRTTVLSVVPPSGRRPWPLSSTSGMAPPFKPGPHSVTFAYSVDYIRKRQRRTVRSWVTEHDFVNLQTASASEVQTAFRIRDSAGDATEVLYYAGNLWWSLPGRPRVSEFLEALASGESAAVGLLSEQLVARSRPVPSKDELSARKIVLDGRDNALAHLQSGATQLLVVEHEVFVRDGSPVYVMWDGRRIETPGNNFSRVVRALNSIDKNPAFEDLSDALTFGNVFGAEGIGEAKKLASETGIEIAVAATIEVLMPGFFQTDPLELQADAAFRKLSRLARIGSQVSRPALREIWTKLDELQESGAPDRSSHDRARALMSFVEWCDRGPQEWKLSYRVERRLAVDAIGRIKRESARRHCPCPFDEDGLRPVDEAALLDLMR